MLMYTISFNLIENFDSALLPHRIFFLTHRLVNRFAQFISDAFID